MDRPFLFITLFSFPLSTLSLTRQASPPQTTDPRSCWNTGHTQGPEVQGDRVPWGVWSRSRRAAERQNRGAATPPKRRLTPSNSDQGSQAPNWEQSYNKV